MPEDELVERLLGRGRADDTEDVIRRRQQVYRDETAPLLEHYRDRLVSVDAVGTVEEITDRVADALPPMSRVMSTRERGGVRGSAGARWRGRDIELKTPASWTRCGPRARSSPARSPRSPRRRGRGQHR